MNLIKSFQSEIKRLLSSTYAKIALVAVICVPLLYGALYLKAFWDPYSKLNELPIAIVNKDSEYKGSNIGNDLVTSLKKSNSLKYQFVSETDADNGLEAGKYYASMTVPSDFTKTVQNVNTNLPNKASIVYKSKIASNYLANSIESRVVSEVVDSLSHKITAKYFNNIFISINDTSKRLSIASMDSYKLTDGLNDAYNGSQDIQTGISSIKTGNTQIVNGLKDSEVGQTKLTNSLSYAANSSSLLQTSADNINNAIASSQTDLSTYISHNPEAANDTNIQSLAYKLGAIKSGQTQIVSGLGGLSGGLQAAQSGSVSLLNANRQLLSGANQLSNGLDKLSLGSSTLTSGLRAAKSGSLQISDGLQSAAKSMEDESEPIKVSKQVGIMSSPISLSDKSYDKANNYGSGLAPYFMSLALWVGGLMTFFILGSDTSKKTRSETIARYLVLCLIGVLQALVLGLVVTKVIGLSVKNIWQYYGFLILVSVSYMSLLQLFIQNLKDAGRYLVVVLLMLQLTSSAGTFPKETLPAFFQIINPLLPMTYAVSGLREILFTNSLSQLLWPVLYFIALIAVPLSINIALSRRSKPKIKVYNK